MRNTDDQKADERGAEARGVAAARAEAFAVDARATTLARGREAVDLAIGEALLRLDETGGFVPLGYSGIADYGREELGLPPRTAFFYVEVARGARERPFLREAVVSGFVSLRKALAILPVAVREHEAAWVRLARTATLEDLALRVKTLGYDPGLDSFAVDTLFLRMTADQQDRLDRAVALAREVLHFPAPLWMCEEVMAMEFLSSHGPFVPDAKAAATPARAAPDGADPDGSDSGGADAKGATSARAAPPPDPEVEAQVAAVRAARRVCRMKDPFDLNRRLHRLMKVRRIHDLPLGKVLRAVVKCEVPKHLGYRSLAEYAEERLGMTDRSVRQRAWLEGKFEELPDLKEAVEKGKIVWTKALLLARRANRETVREAIAEAKTKSCVEMERAAAKREEKRNREEGIRKLWGPRESVEIRALALSVAQAVAEAQGETITEGEGWARVGDSVSTTWTEHLDGERRHRKKKRRRRKKKQDADGHAHDAPEEEEDPGYLGFCQIPKCSRPACHRHHIHWRSRGGGDEPANLLFVCRVHHLRGIHQGYIKVEGRQGEELVFTFLREPGAPVEVWKTDAEGGERRSP